jgi:hypothetical protein
MADLPRSDDVTREQVPPELPEPESAYIPNPDVVAPEFDVLVFGIEGPLLHKDGSGLPRKPGA